MQRTASRISCNPYSRVSELNAPFTHCACRGSGQISDGAGGREAGCVPVKLAPPGVAAVGRGVRRGLPLGLDALRRRRGLRSLSPIGQLSEGRQLAGDRRLVPLSAHDDGVAARERG